MSKSVMEKTIHALTVVGHGGHSLHKGQDGVYLNGVKLIGSIGKGLNVHTIDKGNLQLVQSSAFDTAAPTSKTSSKEEGDTMCESERLLEMLHNVTGEVLVLFTSNGAWEANLTEEAMKKMEEFGCSYLEVIKNGRASEGKEFGQPFACIGEPGLGFGYGHQHCVIEKYDGFGQDVAVVHRAYLPSRHFGKTAVIADGEIGENKKCTMRYINMEVLPPQPPHEAENAVEENVKAT